MAGVEFISVSGMGCVYMSKMNGPYQPLLPRGVQQGGREICDAMNHSTSISRCIDRVG